MSWYDLAITITAALAVVWSSIAGYIAVTDWRERKAWREAEERRRWQQMIDAYRRAYEDK